MSNNLKKEEKFETLEQIKNNLEKKYGNKIAQEVAWDIVVALENVILYDRNIKDEKVKYIIIHDKLKENE